MRKGMSITASRARWKKPATWQKTKGSTPVTMISWAGAPGLKEEKKSEKNIRELEEGIPSPL